MTYVLSEQMQKWNAHMMCRTHSKERISSFCRFVVRSGCFFNSLNFLIFFMYVVLGFPSPALPGLSLWKLVWEN